MNKREERKLKVSFIMSGGLFLASSLHKWGLDWILSTILGIIFIAGLWLSLVWFVRKVFSKL